MSNLLAKLRAMSANGASTPFGRDGPRDSKELQRVLAVPRRKAVPSQELAEKWTARLKRPGGTMSLRPLQALALEEAWRYGGLLGLMGVGLGKTLTSLLLPTVWGSSNAALLIPPNLKTKLWDLEYPELAKHWYIPNLAGHPLQYTDTKAVLHVVTYSQLSSAKSADILDRLGVDDFILDEAHSVRHATAARTKRFRRKVRSPRPLPRSSVAFGDDTPGSGELFRRRVACLSGSITSGSIRDYAHLAESCLGDLSPLPNDWYELQSWAGALDAGDFPSPPGELERLCEPGEPIRSGFCRRLVETPGVVASTTNDPGMSLVFSKRPLEAPKAVLECLESVRKNVRPDGEILREAIEVYACARQVSSGFYYRRVYPRNEPIAIRERWIRARRDYFSEVRERLTLSLPGQDSPLLLWNAAAHGKWKSEYWAEWAAVRKTVEPGTETVWLSDFAVQAAVAWAKEAPGIVWVESEAVKAAFAIAENAGIPVYASQEDALSFYKEDGKRSVVASINAFKQGANLQAFNRNLIMTCPSSGALLEQVIGRTHRPGQMADEVTVDFFMHTKEMVDSLKVAREKAECIEETVLNAQKLNIGTWLF